MNAPTPHIPTSALALAISGGALLVLATALALRARRASQSFAWIAAASIAYPLLAAAAGVYLPETDGLRAAVLQLLSVLLAAALHLTIPTRADEHQASSRSPLAAAARALAWLTLLGLPPAVGFHGRILVYRALLAAGWQEVTVLAVLGGAAALLPACRAIRSPHPAEVRGLRAVLAIAVMATIVALGLYPDAGLAVARLIGNLAAAR